MSYARRLTALVAWSAVVLAAASVLVRCTPGLVGSVGATGSGPDAPVAAAAAAAAWVVLAWLGVSLVACLAEAVGLPAARITRTIAPRALRAAVRATVGVALVSGLVTAMGPARADEGSTSRWPYLERPATAVAATHTPRTYRVVAGDSLWSIAAAHLARGATAAEVARSWPRWWRANRGVIGPDPDLIRVGQVLRAPREPR